jgi:hypothetical protein
MEVFLVNKEFAVSLSTTRFYLNVGDLAWVKKDSSGCCYIYKVGYHIADFDKKIKYHEFMIPINLNYKVCLESTRKDIKEAINDGYMSDITIQYNRNVKINELWKGLEVEI